MSDALEQVLRLVAEGRLSADDAGPILDALGDDARGSERSGQAGAGADRGDHRDEASSDGPPAGPGGVSAIRIEVTDAGRRVVNLRVPISLGRMALDRIPGLSMSTADLVRRALAENRTGTLLAVDDDGDGVRISLE